MLSIAFDCSSCGKSLKVKPELARKKVKCPGCGQVVAVPGLPSMDRERTLPPTMEPPRDVTEQPTQPPPDKSDATHDPSSPDPDHDASLTDFLAPAQADDELGRLGGFRILKILGHGGMGVVFLGEDANLGRKVAIKAMLPHLASSKTSQQRFLREAKAAAALEHDHIVPIFHVAEDRGAPYIVMPFLKGEPLDKRLNRETLPLAEVVRIGREVAEALAAAHAAGLIHRDIKPGNIWLESRGQETGIRSQDRKPATLTPDSRSLTPDFRVKVLDFGLARATSEQAGLTQSGAIVGTPAYMAPEQARGEKVDGRCDLWSLGVMLYRMTTGKLPFTGADSVSTLVAIAMNEPTPVREINSDVPAELATLIGDLMRKNAKDRIGTAAEVVERLRELETTFTSAATAIMRSSQPTAITAAPVTKTRSGAGLVTAPALASKGRGKRVGIIAAVTTALAALVAAAVLYWPRAGHEDADPNKWVKAEGTPIVSPPESYALQFDGQNDYVEIPSLSYAETGPVTIEAFLTPAETDTAAAKPLTLTGNSLRGYVAIERKTKTWSAIAGNDLARDYTGSAHVVASGQRNHVAVVWSGADPPVVFLDGRRYSLSPGKSARGAVKGRLMIGGDIDKNGKLMGAFAGIIDEVRISKVARYDNDFKPQQRFEPDADTLALFHMDEGEGDVLKDSSGHGHHGTIVGAKWVKAEGTPIAPVGPAGYALSFDAASSVDVPTLKHANTAYTIEGYFTVADENKGPGSRIGVAGFDERFLLEIIRQKADESGWFVSRGASAGNRVGPAPLSPQRRVHVAGIRYGTMSHLYLDGKLIASRNVPQQTLATSDGFFLGKGYQGLMREVRVSKGARYDKDFAPTPRFEPDADTLALYHCDEGEGDVLKDSSGNGHHGKIMGAKWVKWDAPKVTARTGFALELDGQSGVFIPTLTRQSGQTMTIEAWVTPVTPEQANMGSSNVICLTGKQGVQLVQNHEHWSMLRATDKKYVSLHSSPSSATSGKRAHIAAVFSEALALQNLFVDGKLQNSKGGSGVWSYSEQKGAYIGSSTGQNGFIGRIENVRISGGRRYSKEFSPENRFERDADTLALYHFDEGQGDVLTDSSGNGHHGKIVGAKWVKVIETPLPPVEPARFALMFQDKDDRLHTKSATTPPRIDLAKPYTLEAFLIPANESDSRFLTASHAVGPDAPSSANLFCGSFLKMVVNRKGEQPKNLISDVLSKAGKRVHVAGLSDGKEFRLYIDGVLKSKSPAFPAPVTGEKPLIANVNVGAQSNYPFVGSLQEVRISSVARYTDNFQPPSRHAPDADTVALYHLDEGQGEVASDSSGNGYHGKITGAKWVAAPPAAP